MPQSGKWVVGQEATDLQNSFREKLGDAEYERRKKIAAEKVEEYPDRKWKEQMVFGNHFEGMAMQASQEIFDQLAEKPYHFWQKLISRVMAK